MTPRSTEKRHVAIIGAGYAGLITAHALKEKGIHVSVFEKQSGPGGLWRYTEHNRQPPDIRHSAEPLSSAIYPDLRTNLPVELMTPPNLPDFFADKATYTQFPGHNAVCQYLERYAKHQSLNNCIHYNQEVLHIKPEKLYSLPSKHNPLTLVVRDLTSHHLSCDQYDAVVVCNGHFNKPYIPEMSGLSDYRGHLIHSLYYREPHYFHDQNVIIAGAGSSAEDICKALSPEARRVYQCRRPDDNAISPVRKGRYGSHNNITQHSPIECCDTRTIRLTDGEILKDIDSIILCTGYQYHFPFISGSLASFIKNTGRDVGPLYMDIFCPLLPELAFIGLPNKGPSSHLMFHQAQYAASIYSGETTLPSSRQMLAACQHARHPFPESVIESGQLLDYQKRNFTMMPLLARLSGTASNIRALETMYLTLGQHRRNFPDNYRDIPMPSS